MLKRVKIPYILAMVGIILPLVLTSLEARDIDMQNTVVPKPMPSATVFRVYMPGLPIMPASTLRTTAGSSATPTAAPTATPSPWPTTVVHEVRSPSGGVRSYTSLADYPRPIPDTGYGFHINGSPYPPNKDIMQKEVVPLLNSLGASWVTVWAADPNQVESVKVLVDNGFQVILRYHPIGKPHPYYVPPVQELAKYVAIGVNYFVTGNEPNLTAENTSTNADDIARQWWLSANHIKEAGGIPLLYPMSPGGDIMNHRTMLERIMLWLKNNGALGTFDNAGVAVHNRPHNKPLDVRDDTSFLEYEWIDDLMISYLGHSIPIFGTEAGYTLGDLVDKNYPRIDDNMHRDYNLAIIQGFQTARWRDSLFTQDFWLLGEFGHYAFPAEWWIKNPIYYGKDLPIVEALRNMPKSPRMFKSGGYTP